MNCYACMSFLVAVAVVVSVESRSVVKREVKLSAAIDPHNEHIHGDDAWRDKRKIEHKFDIKNAILGLVFNKINSFIDQKTAWVDQLDKTNIAKNKAHGIYPPKDAVTSISHIISGAINDKLQAAGPVISLVTSKLAGGSSGHGAGFNKFGGLFAGSSGGGHAHAGAGISAYGAV